MSASAWTAVGSVSVPVLVLLGVIWKVIVHEIREELKPNGGNSLKDAVNRIEDRLGRLERKLDTWEQLSLSPAKSPTPSAVPVRPRSTRRSRPTDLPPST